MGWDQNQYPSNWDSIRKKVYKRDGYRCQNCGYAGGPKGNAQLHAHHIVPAREGGSDTLANLTTVCRSCHESIHNHRIPTGPKNVRQDNGSIIHSIVAMSIAPFKPSNVGAMTEFFDGVAENAKERNREKFGTDYPPYGKVGAYIMFSYCIIGLFLVITDQWLAILKVTTVFVGIMLIFHLLEQRHRIDK